VAAEAAGKPMTQRAATFPFSHVLCGTMPTRRGVLRMLVVAACLSFPQPFAAVAQTNAPAPLPPAAQEALNKGIIAAKVPDYPLAIRFFEDARKLAPTAPVIFMSLGIAESKMPGRELRAIAWFGAYLAASPDAPNAAAVKEQIAVLEVKSQSDLSRLIKVVQDAAGQIREEPPPTSMARDKSYILNQVSMLWLAVGDTARAQKAAELIQTANWKDSAFENIANKQIKAGEVADASRTAGRIQSKDQRNKVQKAILDGAAKTQPTSKAVVNVSDWLDKLGSERSAPSHWTSGFGSLNTELFLDLNGYLKLLPPPSAGLHAHFWALQETAGKIIDAQKAIDEMLKAQIGT
jgi:tetratricopeptide (TPR) repeat protein